MIQRIQSVYLLLVAILLVVALCLPVGQFIGPDGIAAHVFKPLGVTLADGNFQSTWGLFGILLLSAIIALCTIFLFRNRMLQVRMTVFGSLLLIGYYIAFFAFMFILKNDLNARRAALRIFSGRIILNLPIGKICGFSRLTFSRVGS